VVCVHRGAGLRPVAIAVLNAVLGAGTHPGGGFVGRLRQGFVVAVNCTEPGGLCSCASMGRAGL
jgi:hypothetical protein